MIRIILLHRHKKFQPKRKAGWNGWNNVFPSISQLEKQKKAIQAREDEKRRKERTRRLIQIGAIAIKYLDCPNDIEPEEFEENIKSLIDKIGKKYD